MYRWLTKIVTRGLLGLFGLFPNSQYVEEAFKAMLETWVVVMMRLGETIRRLTVAFTQHLSTASVFIR